MKKNKVILSFFMGVLVLVLFSAYIKRQHHDINSEWTLSTIKALAFGENEGSYFCIGIGSLD